MKQLLTAISLFLPWRLRRLLLVKLLGYQLHPTCKLGLAWVLPKKLVMDEYSSIGHFTVCKGMDLLHLGRNASIGRGNWIAGYPSDGRGHYFDQPGRSSELILGEHSAITNRHLIDCTNAIHVGRFATVAGYRSQILTHSVDLVSCRQSSSPVRIGEFCFVGTGCVILGGARLPDYSVLGAMALLNKEYSQAYTLYAGVPARPIKSLAAESAYFARAVGYVR